MRQACRAAALTLLAAASLACEAKSAQSAQLAELSFSMPCAALRGYFGERGVKAQGDPTRLGDHTSILLQDSTFRVLEIRCARLPNDEGDTEPMPAELSFFSGGEDTEGRLTKEARRLEEELRKSYGDPLKKMKTARWESVEWSGGPLIVREFLTSEEDTLSLHVIFSRYPSNSPELLDAHLRSFLEKRPSVSTPEASAN